MLIEYFWVKFSHGREIMLVLPDWKSGWFESVGELLDKLKENDAA